MNKNELKKIKGGASPNLSGTILKQFNNLIQILMDAGRSLGSSLRRIESDNICPLE